MSRWTYIDGVVKVSVFPGRTRAECRYILDTVLDHLPKVTGEERDMKIYAVQPEGHSFCLWEPDPMSDPLFYLVAKYFDDPDIQQEADRRHAWKAEVVQRLRNLLDW